MSIMIKAKCAVYDVGSDFLTVYTYSRYAYINTLRIGSIRQIDGLTVAFIKEPEPKNDNDYNCYIVEEKIENLIQIINTGCSEMSKVLYKSGDKQ